MPSALPDLLTVPQVAYQIDCSPWFVRRLIERGELPATRPGRIYQIKREHLLEWVDSLLVYHP